MARRTDGIAHVAVDELQIESIEVKARTSGAHQRAHRRAFGDAAVRATADPTSPVAPVIRISADLPIRSVCVRDETPKHFHGEKAIPAGAPRCSQCRRWYLL